jgi:hypothetical protein
MVKASPVAKVRARCVWWLTGQCHEGPECRRLPPSGSAAKTETEEDSEED